MLIDDSSVVIRDRRGRRPAVPAPAADSRPTPEDTAIAEADAQAPLRAIAALPVGFREVLLLREQEDPS